MSAPSPSHAPKSVRIRVVAVSSEQRIIETEHQDGREALLAALGQIPLGFTIASVDVIDQQHHTR